MTAKPHFERRFNRCEDFYSSKTGSQKKHPLPDTLSHQDVVQILHDHSVLSQILWPHSSTTVRAKTSTVSGTSRFIVGPEGSGYNATISSQTNGVTCVEELPLGFQITITYAVAGRDQVADQIGNDSKDEAASSSSLLHFDTSSLDRRLYLVEGKSMTAPKPAMLLMKWKDEETVQKTKNLLQVLGFLGENGNDILAALADLNGSTAPADSDTFIEKAKDE